ncbi:MAG: glycosyltransferase [Verrucomicrobiota bacterium]|nr:glycosyltransferase [Verrucomicrobiota bacterium]
MPPLVSICLPCLNARPFLAPRMESILAQTLKDWELIVCDSHSADGSWEFLETFRADPQVRLHQVPREGAYAGWNECLRRATGEFVYIATADDTCEPPLLERTIEAVEKGRVRGSGFRCQVSGKSDQRPESSIRDPVSSSPSTPDPRPMDIAVCDYRVIDAEGKTLDLDLNKHPRQFYGEWMSVPHARDGRTEFIVHACLGIVWVTMTAVLFRRRLLGRIGLFRTDRGVAADHEWQLRACLVSDIAYVPDKLATWRLHGSQASAQCREQYYDRNILLSLESVLDDPASGIPAEWKRVAGWREKILEVQRSLYHDGFALYGNVARRAPARFLRNVGRALREQPGLLLRQALRGFRWSPEFSVDGFSTARQLMGHLECPWPPSARTVGDRGSVS